MMTIPIRDIGNANIPATDGLRLVRRKIPYKDLPLWWKLLNFACRNAG